MQSFDHTGRPQCFTPGTSPYEKRHRLEIVAWLGAYAEDIYPVKDVDGFRRDMSAHGKEPHIDRPMYRICRSV